MKLHPNRGLMRKEVWVVAGMFLGYIVADAVCIWWLVPKWAAKYPHDGQLGLGAMAAELFGCVAGGIAGYLIQRFLNDTVFYDRDTTE